MKKNSVVIILDILLGLNLLAWLAVWELRPAKAGLEVTFFDVGQGDAIFIETPQRHQILIDGGPTSVILEKLGGEMPFWDRTIDLVILTHPEHDHMAGLLEVLKRYKIKNILWTGVVRDTAEYAEWQKLIKEEGASIHIAQSGRQIKWSRTGPGQLNILHPLDGLEGKEMKNTNNTSIIARLVFGGTSFLFMGDVYQSVERELLEKNVEIDSDVLKAGHHGSKTSSGPGFIKAVSPEIAVISAGRDNSYGHPHTETLQRLSGSEILRTDLAGDIKIVSSGTDYVVKN